MSHILITGASGGIGAALADHYAAPGARLTLWGRDEGRLGATASACRERGAEVETGAFDIRDLDELTARLRALDERFPVDLAIFNAGVGGIAPLEFPGETAERAREQALTNFAAPVVGASAIAESMAERKRGRIVLIGSVAGAFPLPMSPTYSGAKGGLETFADALRLRLEPHGVGVTLIAPGYVDTAMSRAVAGPQPFLITAEMAAASIVRGIARGKGSFTIPWQYALLRRLAGVIPAAVTRAVLRRVQRQLVAEARRVAGGGGGRR